LYDDTDFVNDTQTLDFFDELIVIPSLERGTANQDLNMTFEGVSDDENEKSTSAPKWKVNDPTVVWDVICMLMWPLFYE